MVTLWGVGEIVGNVPTSKVDGLKIVYPWVGAIAVILLLPRGLLSRSLTPVGVYTGSYLGLLFLWPHYTTRLWMPVLPLLIAYGTATAREAMLHRRFRVISIAYLAWFCSTGFVALAYTTRISLSSRNFPKVYGIAGGMATPGFEDDNPEYNGHVTRLLRRYGTSAQRNEAQ